MFVPTTAPPLNLDVSLKLVIVVIAPYKHVLYGILVNYDVRVLLPVRVKHLWNQTKICHCYLKHTKYVKIFDFLSNLFEAKRTRTEHNSSHLVTNTVFS